MMSVRQTAEYEIKALLGIISNEPLEMLYVKLLKHEEKQTPEEIREDLQNDPMYSLDALLENAPTIEGNPLEQGALVAGRSTV